MIEKSLAIRPDDRYQSANEYKQALLTAGGFTRRKTGEYLVSPAPAGHVAIKPNLILDDPAQDPLTPGYYPTPRNRSPLPIPTSKPLSEPVSVVNSKRKRRRVTSLLVIILLAVLTGTAVYLYDPDLPAQALSLVMPSPTSQQPASEIVTPSLPSNTPTQSQQEAEAVAPTQQSISSPTSTQAPSPTPRPSATAVAVVNPLPSPTALPTPVGGGEGQIAFASDRSGATQVWIMNVDGSGLMQVTDMPEGACQPEWSPDGMSLVFISPCDRNQEQYRGAGLFIINADLSGLTPLPSVPGGDYDPAWAPDGSKIAFTSLRNGGRSRIYVIDLVNMEVERLSEQYSYDRQPGWSRDGSRLAFVTTQKGPVQIWTMDPDGSNQELFSRSADAINSHPVWSPDNEVILFTQVSHNRRVPGIVAASYQDDEYSEFRYELGPAPVREAKYSPDGLWLVSESWPEGSNHDIYIMTASGAARTRLTDWSGDDFDPVWRPIIASSDQN